MLSVRSGGDHARAGGPGVRTALPA